MEEAQRTEDSSGGGTMKPDLAGLLREAAERIERYHPPGMDTNRLAERLRLAAGQAGGGGGEPLHCPRCADLTSAWPIYVKHPKDRCHGIAQPASPAPTQGEACGCVCSHCSGRSGGGSV